MKKKILTILLCGVLVFGLTGCGAKNEENDNNETESKNSKATIVDNKGTTAEMSAKELYDIYNENELKFDKYYDGAKIQLTGTVEKVKENGICGYGVYEINLEDDWAICLYQEGNEDFVTELSKGTKIKANSNVGFVHGKQIYIHGVKCDENGENCEDDYDKITISVDN